jgi:hypothetical protein
MLQYCSTIKIHPFQKLSRFSKETTRRGSKQGFVLPCEGWARGKDATGMSSKQELSFSEGESCGCAISHRSSTRCPIAASGLRGLSVSITSPLFAPLQTPQLLTPSKTWIPPNNSLAYQAFLLCSQSQVAAAYAREILEINSELSKSW